MTAPRILIMAGGTGGHIFPAQAVATELQQQGWQIHWLGTAERMEAQLVPQFGWPFHAIEVSGLRGKGIMSLLKAPWMLLKSVLQARSVIRRLQPDLVLGFGGYASGPGGMAAWLAGIPLVIHEQNAVAGSTNRLLARFARYVLVAFPAAFAGREKRKVTGNPVRAAVIGSGGLHQDKSALRVLVIGGSLGAKALNESLPVQFAKATAQAPLQIRHQTGKVMQEQVQAVYQQLQQQYPALQAEATAFIDDMAQAYQWADLVVCRAGASTVSEIACAGVAAVFVPLPGAIDDHQTENARWLSSQQAAVLLPQQQLADGGLLPLLQHWLQDRTGLQQMAVQARACAIDDATVQVAAVCREVTGVTA
ncbi:undecaprenyldiphospho-muramoylpentapeptide beta-N-acetylglucosaminyltransferase [Chromatiaceae bacterium AAb-1]|nr:undecaprenyldiphospho-muramoylpentapeptide beta-N-acetylglucosaminyltransferase [Chromatiaceae bacterium AAb-1]